MKKNNIKSKYFVSEELVLATEIFHDIGLLLFPIFFIANDNNGFNHNNTFFNTVAMKMKVDITVIQHSILQYIDRNLNNPSFLLTVYEPDESNNENSLLQKQHSILDMMINFDIKKNNITNLSLPFILNNFSYIFPNYEIVVFSCKDDKIKDVFYPPNIELHLFDANKSNSIAIMHYDNVYKLLTNMSAKYMYTNDSDDSDIL